MMTFIRHHKAAVSSKHGCCTACSPLPQELKLEEQVPERLTGGWPRATMGHRAAPGITRMEAVL